MLDYRVISPADFLVHEWSGGVTSEIFLYPEGSDYQNKTFEIRISSAVITQEGTPYSDFSGYCRLICPIKGEMRIVHENHHKGELKTFEVDRFEGSWLTKSFGLCTDFNLLYSKDWSGDMKKISAPSQLTLASDSFHGFFSCAEISIDLTLRTASEQMPLVLHPGEFLLIYPGVNVDLTLNADRYCPAIYVSFRKNNSLTTVQLSQWLQRVRDNCSMSALNEEAFLNAALPGRYP